MRKRWLLPAALAAALTFAAPAQAARDYVGLVNPWVEADIGRYFFFQSASSPFGFVKLRPDTSTNAVWGTGYRRNENEVKGFSHIHDWQFSGIQVMPTSGVLPLKTRGDTGWQSHVEHDDSEVAQPGYHRLHLDRYDITAELTSTDRVGIHRYRFEQDGPGEIIVNLGGKLGEANMKDAHVTRVGKRSIEGWVNQRGDGYASHDTKLFFDIRVDRPFDSMRGWVRDKLRDEPLDELSGDQMGVWLRYDHLRRGEVVQMKVGALADRQRRRDAQPHRRGARLELRRHAPRGAEALERHARARRRERRHAPAAGQVLHRPLPRAVRAQPGLRRRRPLHGRHVERGRRPARGSRHVQLRRAVADAVERQLDARPGVSGGLLGLREVPAADVQGRRAAAARPGRGQLLDGDDRLAGDVLHHGRVEQGHPRL